MHKHVILERISANGSKFDASNEGFFLCPTCLSKISLKSTSDISKAHIIPRYSKGTLTTYLCKKCNSAFGQDQDYWLGEYLYLIDGPKGLFATRKKEPTFRVNGVEVRGEFKEAKDRVLEFYIYENLMSPDRLAALRVAETPGGMEIEVVFPVLRETQSIKVGFLTAGYLLWFKELGYSWILQHHMASVRSQILNPRKPILPSNFVVDAGDKYFQKPWIGFLELRNDYLPCAGIAAPLLGNSTSPATRWDSSSTYRSYAPASRYW